MAAQSQTGPFMYVTLPDLTRVSSGGNVCEGCTVYLELPPTYVFTYFEKYNNARASGGPLAGTTSGSRSTTGSPGRFTSRAG